QPSQVRRVIGVVFQDPALDDRLTGWENLDFHARLYGMGRREREERVEEVLRLVGLREWADELVENYSGGMKRRLEIARGLIHRPRVLFLDEPTLGLDVQTRRAIWEYILALNRREEVTVFLTTHYMEEADYLSHRVAIIDRGRILAVDEPRNLKDMIGGDVVIVSCSDPGPLAEELMRQDWVREVKTRGSEISVYVDRGEKKIPEIVMIAERLGIAVDSILLREPTLEDVYLKFTGRSIREEIADAVEKMRSIARRRMRR
ncbi:MAG: ATP-binding cassette domain-containing protein, partial [Nitrososphaerota archaeon]